MELNNESHNKTMDSRVSSRPIRVKLIICISAVLLAGSFLLFILCFSLYNTSTLTTLGLEKGQESIQICNTSTCIQTSKSLKAAMNESINPCDDFYEFACGNYIKKWSNPKLLRKLPRADTIHVLSVNFFSMIHKEIINITSNFTKNVEMEYEEKDPIYFHFVNKYAACVSNETKDVDEEDLEEVVDFIDTKIIPKDQSISKTMGKLKRMVGLDYIFKLDVKEDYKKPGYNTVYITKLPRQDEVLTKELVFNISSELDESYGNSTSYFSRMATNADSIVEYDQKINSLTTHKTGVYKRITIKQLNQLLTQHNLSATFDWLEYFETIFEGIIHIDDNLTIVIQDDYYVSDLIEFLKWATPQKIQLHLLWDLIYNQELFPALLADLSEDEEEEISPNTKTTKSATKTQCLLDLYKDYSILLAHKFMFSAFNEELIEGVTKIIQNLIETFSDSVSTMSWLDNESKAKAIIKLKSLRSIIGGPAWTTNSSAVEEFYKGSYNFSCIDPEFNELSFNCWFMQNLLATAFQKVDVNKLLISSSLSPTDVNAYYAPEFNYFFIPAGFLQFPFIGSGLSSMDYGSLGSTIGHEMVHAFGTTGINHDHIGNLNPLLSKEAKSVFEQKLKCFENEYNNFEIPELNNTQKINGSLTLNENISDNGGVRIALKAYRNFVKSQKRDRNFEPRLTGFENYTPEQLFFLSLAHSWCSAENLDELPKSIKTENHVTPRFKIFGSLVNFEEFSKVWNCPSGTRMNPEHKCVLWD